MSLQLLNDVGYRYPTSSSKRKKLYATYLCLGCNNKFDAMVTNIKTGNTSNCNNCAKEIRVKTRTKWTYEKLLAEALKYSTRNEFKINSNSAYSSARKRKLLDDVCGHMICGKTLWTRDTILGEAKKYNCRIDFQMGSGSAYAAARKLGVVDDACSTMNKGQYSSDNDAVYIWNVVDAGKPTDIYKVGVTSLRLGKKRISECASAGGLGYKIISLEGVSDAKSLESRLLRMGIKVFVGKFNGSTEFVNLTEGQLKEAISLIATERCSAINTSQGVSLCH